MKLDITNKNHLVVSGCSFTDGFEMKERGSWAYYLSNMLNLELHNQARGGSGNEFIADSVIHYLMNNDDVRENCIVGIAWSDVSRLMSPINEGTYSILDTVQPQDFINFGEGQNGKYSNIKEASKFFSDIMFCIYKTYMSITKLNHFLDFYNIPYFYIDAINKNKIDINEDSVIMTSYLNEKTELLFEGCPIYYKKVLNQNFNKKIFNNFLKINEFDSILEYISNNDSEKLTKGNPGHPNDIASNEVAQIIYNQII